MEKAAKIADQFIINQQKVRAALLRRSNELLTETALSLQPEDAELWIMKISAMSSILHQNKEPFENKIKIEELKGEIEQDKAKLEGHKNLFGKLLRIVNESIDLFERQLSKNWLQSTINSNLTSQIIDQFLQDKTNKDCRDLLDKFIEVKTNPDFSLFLFNEGGFDILKNLVFSMDGNELSQNLKDFLKCPNANVGLEISNALDLFENKILFRYVSNQAIPDINLDKPINKKIHDLTQRGNILFFLEINKNIKGFCEQIYKTHISILLIVKKLESPSVVNSNSLNTSTRILDQESTNSRPTYNTLLNALATEDYVPQQMQRSAPVQQPSEARSIIMNEELTQLNIVESKTEPQSNSNSNSNDENEAKMRNVN